MISYECANVECFYVAALLDFSDVVFKQIYSHEVDDLILVPFCPCCQEPMMEWDEQATHEVRNGTLQAKLF